MFRSVGGSLYLSLPSGSSAAALRSYVPFAVLCSAPAAVRNALPQTHALPRTLVQNALPRTRVQNALPRTRVQNALPRTRVQNALPRTRVQKRSAPPPVQSKAS